MMKKNILLSCMALTVLHLSAQSVDLYPVPQEQTVGHAVVKTPIQFKLVGEAEANPNAVKALKALLGNRIQPDGFPIYIGEVNDKAIRPFKKKIPAHKEGYWLSLNAKQLVLAGQDARGTYYAVQTLRQLLTQDLPADSLRSELPETEIKDYPDIASRGVVEGFYGTPWSHEARLSQLRFYGQNKMNTYIYGPKDDPYHSTPNWRLPYPEKEARQLQELIETARENEVNFVWAIHPGQDIRWNEEDRNKVIEKFENLYALGARAFAIFFDDISGEGTDPNRQAELLNYIDDHFVKPKKDVDALIMCPTEYNKSWSNPNGGYLTTLGSKLNPSIRIMWTGDRVIADMNRPGMEWINTRIKRPAYIWWNFPVSDYVRDHLLMGRVYGNEKGLAKEMSGFVSNPMEHAESSKIALYGVADYSWNMAKFDSEKNWQYAIGKMMPEEKEELYTFCRHNSDLGKNGHGYRRTESEGIHTSDRMQMAQEFERINEAAEVLLTSKSNPALLQEIKPWVIQFKTVGELGSAVMKLDETTDKERFMQLYRYARALQEEFYENDQKANQNPYQPGVKSASLVMKPYADSLFAVAVERFNTTHGTKLENRAIYSPHQLSSNVPQLKNQPLLGKNGNVMVSPLLEVVKWPAHGHLTIELDKTYPIYALQLNFGSKTLPTWLVIETSTDGATWQPVSDPTQMKGKTARYVRLSSNSDREEQTRLQRCIIQLTK